MCLKYCYMSANSVDPDQMVHYAPSDQGLHVFAKHVCLIHYITVNRVCHSNYLK